MHKLFKVLVLGGALLPGAFMADSVLQSQGASQGPKPVEAIPAGTEPIFCTEPDACVSDCNGEKKVKEGFHCCWGTSCDDVN